MVTKIISINMYTNEFVVSGFFIGSSRPVTIKIWVPLKEDQNISVGVGLVLFNFIIVLHTNILTLYFNS